MHSPPLTSNAASRYLKYVEIVFLHYPSFQISEAASFLVLFYGKKELQTIISNS